MIILDGRKLQKELLATLGEEVKQLPFQPIFTDVLVGEDAVSRQYVELKKRKAEEVGMRFQEASFPESITTEELVIELKKLNTVEHMCGIIIQLPLPAHIDKRAVLDAIHPELDVDCLSTAASTRFYDGDAALGFPTALACMYLFDAEGVDLKEKNIVVLGQGELVGRPVATLLRSRGYEPVCIDSKTENSAELIKNADIIISGIGKGKFITGDMIKHGAILIDAGTSEEGAGIVGDVDQESVRGIAGALSPVPGGVGPVTVAMLLKNVLTVAQQKNYE